MSQMAYPLVEGRRMSWADHDCYDHPDGVYGNWVGPLEWSCPNCIRMWHLCHLLFGTDPSE